MNIKDLKPGSYKIASDISEAAPSNSKSPDVLESLSSGLDAVFGGKKIGESLGTLGVAGGQALGAIPGGLQGASDTLKTMPTVPQLIGDYTKAGTTALGAAAPVSKTFLGSAAQFGALSGAVAAGQSLSQGDPLQTTVQKMLTAGGVGAATGGAFNLLGKAISYVGDKTSPAVLSFTSGVPKAAIEKAAENPEVSRQGTGMSVEEIRNMAVNSHSQLSQELGTEFSNGLKALTDRNPIAPLGAENIPKILNDYADKLAAEFKVGLQDTAEGPALDFSKSAIVKGGEQNTIKEAIQTLRTWDDFSPSGMQDLAARMGALRNFESGAQTRSSAIIGKIYDKIAGDNGKGIIPHYYPELAGLRKSYSETKGVLDEIGNVLNASGDKPTQIQASVSRLSNLFKEDKETYMNAIRQLADRSGVDYLSLLIVTGKQIGGERRPC